MKSRNIWIPTLLLAGYGGLLGFLKSTQYGRFYWGGDGLISPAYVAAFCPLWLLTPEAIHGLESLMLALQAILLSGIALCAWSRCGGPQFLQALRQGTTPARGRQLLLRAALGTLTMSVLTGLWSGTLSHAPASAISCLLGLLTFLPALWAAGQHRRLQALLARPADCLTASEFRLWTALLSPIVLAPAASVLLPGLEANRAVCTLVSCFAYRMEDVAPGPWPSALLGATFFGCVGLALAGRKLVAIALGAALLHSVPLSQPAPVVAKALQTYQLTPLDPAIGPSTVTGPTDSALLSWNPRVAYAELAQDEAAWFRVHASLLTGLANMRPGDREAILPEQLALVQQAFYLHDRQLRPAGEDPLVARLLQSQNGPCFQLRGKLELDGQPLAGARVRFERIPQQRQGATAQDWVASHNNCEVGAGKWPAEWACAFALQSFYAQTVTGPDGSFAVSGLERGQYELVLRTEGRHRLQTTDGPGAISLEDDRSLPTIHLTTR